MNKITHLVNNVFTPKKDESRGMFLDFLVIFHKNGLPIFSRCYSDICSLFIKDDVLFSGFLSAIVSFPQSLGMGKNELQFLKMGKSDLYFSYGDQDELVFVIGMKNSKIEKFQKKLIQISMNELNNLFSNYSLKDWSRMPDELYSEIELKINSQVVNHWFKETNTHDTCVAGDNCPFIAVTEHGRRKNSIFDSFKQVYSSIRRNNIQST